MTKYSREFKEEALKLSDEIGVKTAALQLGVPYYTLADWRGRCRERIMNGDKPAGKKAGATEQEARIRELERENAELKTANEILKEALGFFVKDRKK